MQYRQHKQGTHTFSWF